MRKRIKTDKLYKDLKPGNLPAFNEKPGRLKIRYFWQNGSGKASKRAFFFSLFAFIAVLYITLCISRLAVFNQSMGLFILGCNAAFGYNYYKNETCNRNGYSSGEYNRRNSYRKTEMEEPESN